MVGTLGIVGLVRWIHDMVRKDSYFPQVALLKRRCWGDPQCGPRYRSREEARGSRETRFLSHMQVAWHRWELGAERSRCHRQVELRDPE